MNQRILIIEDNEIISEQLKFYFKSQNYDCLVFDTGEEALVEVKNYSPDIIILDIRLSGSLDGIATAKRLKKLGDYPIVFFTSYLEPHILELAAEVEPAAFLSKNVAHSELKLQIQYILIKSQKEKERKKKLAEFENSINKYEKIFNASRDAILFLDNQAYVTYWNDSAEKIFGYTKSDAIGKQIISLILPDYSQPHFYNDYKKWLSQTPITDFHKTFNIQVINSNKRTFTCEMSFGIVEYLGEVIVCCFAKDVTEKVIAEEEISKLIEEMQISKEIIEQNASEMVMLNSKLIESEEILQELNASKDKFFSIIAHDLKGPFQGLLGYSQILSNDLPSLTIDEIAEVAKSLNDSANHLFKLLENLLNWSRLQRGVLECNPIDFELDLLIKQNVDLASTNANQKDISVTTDIPPSLYVFADLNMVNTILRNLISNAIKFTHRKGNIRIIAEHYSNSEVIIKISDNGIGMDEVLMSKIFRIDTHTSGIGTEKEVGTGLGLILCRDIAEKNNGRILVESEVGKGTTFSVILPKGRMINAFDN